MESSGAASLAGRWFAPSSAAAARVGVAARAGIGGFGRRSSVTEKPVVSVSNHWIKHCVKLRLSAAYRRASQSLLLVGLAPILEISQFQSRKDSETSEIECLLLLDGIKAPKELRSRIHNMLHVTPTVMKKISGMQSVDSTEAIAVVKMPKSFRCLETDQDGSSSIGSLFRPHRLLVLDGIQDPGNLGTLIRSACAFKWDGIFLLNPGCCDPFNEKALRASRGASFQIPVISGNWVHLNTLCLEHGMKMMAGHPQSLCDDSPRTMLLSLNLAAQLAGEPLCLVLGSEGNGISKETMSRCELISIPMESTFDSLNVSVAGGIFLFMLQSKNKL